MAEMARTSWASDDIFGHVLAALTPANRLAVTVSALTGLRISDVLALTVEQVRRGRFTVTESKTMKRRQVRLPARLQDDILRQAGKIYAFPCRTDERRHRTRQAVYRDIKRAQKLFRIRGNLGTHTARKIYAVREYRRDFNARRVQRLLNHSSESVTMLYILADQISAARQG